MESSRLMKLPKDVLVNILRRVPEDSVCCLRCVSKTMLTIVVSPSFVELNTSFLAATIEETPPQLIALWFSGSYVPRCHSYEMNDYSSRNAWDIIGVESLKYDGSQGIFTTSMSRSALFEDCRKIKFVFYNLLCTTPQLCIGEASLVDPFRKQVLRLPKAKCRGKSEPINDLYGMGIDETSTYKILCVSEIGRWTGAKGNYKVAQVLELGTSSWREVPVARPISLGHFYSSKMVCVYGNAHWLFRRNKTRLDEYDDFEPNFYEWCGYKTGKSEKSEIEVVSFDFKKEKFYFSPLPATSSRKIGELHLSTFRGCMTLMDSSARKNIKIWMMKAFNEKKWTLEYEIKIQTPNRDLICFWDVTCYEWEHGIFLEDGNTSLFLDLDDVSSKFVSLKNELSSHKYKTNYSKVLSFKRSLVSLEKFGKLVEGQEKRKRDQNAEEQNAVVKRNKMEQ